MPKGPLEAFADGVMAIIITIMVLELKVPHGDDLATLWSVWPVLLSYVPSFLYVGICWNNQHHLMHAAKDISAGVLWANMHLLFWLSLLPFSTGWMGENHFARLPVALPGANCLWRRLPIRSCCSRSSGITGRTPRLPWRSAGTARDSCR